VKQLWIYLVNWKNNLGQRDESAQAQLHNARMCPMASWSSFAQRPTGTGHAMVDGGPRCGARRGMGRRRGGGHDGCLTGTQAGLRWCSERALDGSSCALAQHPVWGKKMEGEWYEAAAADTGEEKAAAHRLIRGWRLRLSLRLWPRRRWSTRREKRSEHGGGAGKRGEPAMTHRQEEIARGGLSLTRKGGFGQPCRWMCLIPRERGTPRLANQGAASGDTATDWRAPLVSSFFLNFY
jgi:hypothetical protein